MKLKNLRKPHEIKIDQFHEKKGHKLNQFHEKESMKELMNEKIHEIHEKKINE